MNTSEKIEKVGLVPVIKINKVEHALPLAESLLKAGLTCLEITFRTEVAKDVIKAIKDSYPELIVGAGTITTRCQVDDAIQSGADFIVSPGINPHIVKYCQANKVPIYPGCATPSEIELAIELGLKIVKFFPSENLGGISTINSLSQPYSEIKFFPTGGIKKENIKEYISNSKVFACGGSWMVPTHYIDEEKFDEIGKLANEAVKSMLGFELAHIGINSKNEEEAKKTSSLLADLFKFEQLENSGSIFLDSFFEILKNPFLGEKGHIAIRTNSVERAIYYLENKGVKFNYNTISYNDQGLINTIYFEKDICGFAIHLLRK